MSEAAITAILGEGVLEGLRRPIETARPLGPAAYTSAEFFRLEQRSLFGRSWMGAAFAHQVAAPGDAIPVEVAGVPLILLRDREGTVRGFHNVCRHRGSMILTEPVRGRPTLRCPYHNWTYGLDGALRATPLFDGKRANTSAGLDRATHGLAPVRVAVWSDVVFVDLSGAAPPIEAFVAPMAALWEPYDMDRLRFAHYESGEAPSNWKFAVEAAIENYHEEFVHQGLPARVDEAGKKTFTELTDGALFGFTWSGDSTLRSPTPLVPLRSNRPDIERIDNLCFLFPNTQLTLFGGLAVRTLWQPVAVDRMRWESSWYFVDDAATDETHGEIRAEIYRYWRQLRADDRQVLDLMQRGRKSPASEQVRLSPFWEGLILHFQRRAIETMAAAP